MPIRIWLRRVFILAIVLFAASIGLSRALRTNALRRYLIAHLESSFGRPVDVGRFTFSLLDGARLEANSITIAEDPRFGNEYFLRADTLRAGLRWTALLSGRFEFGTFSLSRPSLNLVRNSLGRWNIEQWLPPAPPNSTRPGFVGAPAASRSIFTARLYRIAVDGGRINFKQGDDKNSLALIGVSGRVDQDAAGRWTLDLEAQPMRAGVELQQIGTLRVRGNIAGTSARLQPAELSISWSNVSLADALRLTRDSDLGVRGELSVDLTARVAPSGSDSQTASMTGGAQWSITGGARLSGFHGWRLPGRGSDPAANLSFDAAWRLGEAHTRVPKFLFETPNSHLQGAGELDWTHGLRPELRLDSSVVGFADVLAWYRALRPGIPANLEMEGKLGVDATLGGWPLQLEKAAFSSAGGKLSGAPLPSALQIGAISARIFRGALEVAPTEITFAPPPLAGSAAAAADAGDASANSFTVRAAIVPDPSAMFHRPPNWNVTIAGATPRIENWLALSDALAQPLNANWVARGGLAVNVQAVHTSQLPATAWTGTIDSRNLSLSAPYLNQPLRFPKARLELAKSQRSFTLSAGEAFGATWRGTVVRTNADPQWTFDLVADRLDAADLDRWLGPRARPSLIARLTGSSGKLAADSLSRDTAIAGIAAHGRLRINELVLAPLHVEQFDGQAELAGRTITIRKAYAGFFGGKAAGTFMARLLPDPTYQFQGRFDRVDVARLASAMPSLSERMAGMASATLTLAAHGVGRETLARSIQGSGSLDARNVVLRDFDFGVLVSGDNQDPQPGRYASVQGDFQVADGGVELRDIIFDNSQGQFQADGHIGFSHALNLRIHPSIFHATTTLASAPPPSFALGGTVESPVVVQAPPPGRIPSKSGARPR